MKFDRDLFGAIDFENAWRDIAIETHFRIGVVVHEQNVAIVTGRHHTFEILARCDGRRWIVGIVEIQNTSACQCFLWNVIELDEEIGARP